LVNASTCTIQVTEKDLLENIWNKKNYLNRNIKQ
jgi:hypothetical protein